MGAEFNRKRREKREELTKRQGGLCHFCTCELVSKSVNTRHFPKNLATLFHLRDRFHPDREKPNKGKKAYVVSCWQCANEQGAARQAEQPIEVLWHRSKRHPTEFYEAIDGAVGKSHDPA